MIAEGACWPASSIQAAIYNVNRGRGSKAMTPDDFNPIALARKRERVAMISSKDLSALLKSAKG